MLLEVMLRRFGNSTGVVLPPAVLRHQKLHPGSLMTLHASTDGKITLVLAPQPTLSDLVAQCDPQAKVPVDVALWDQLLSSVREGDR